MNLSFVAEYPGATPREAYSGAVAGLETVPFTWLDYNIDVEGFLTPRRVISEPHADGSVEEAYNPDDPRWTWVATLKARG